MSSYYSPCYLFGNISVYWYSQYTHELSTLKYFIRTTNSPYRMLSQMVMLVRLRWNKETTVHLHCSLSSFVEKDGDQTSNPPLPSIPSLTYRALGILTQGLWPWPFEHLTPSSQKVKQFVSLEWLTSHPLVRWRYVSTLTPCDLSLALFITLLPHSCLFSMSGEGRGREQGKA